MRRSALAGMVFVVAFFRMRDLGFQPRSLQGATLIAEMKSVGRASIKYGWEVRPIRLMMLASFVQMGFLAWGFYAWQPYFLELLGSDAVWVAGVVSSDQEVGDFLDRPLCRREADSRWR